MKKTCISKDWMLYALDSDGYIPVQKKGRIKQKS